MTVALALPLLKLSNDERATAAGLRARLQRVRVKNDEKARLYEGKSDAADFGISAPKMLPELINAVIGWPGTVVDALEERLEFRGWTGIDDFPTLHDVYRDNQLNVESGRGHLDALIYGCGFIALGTGVPGDEAKVLVTIESTESCTVDWNYRTRRANSGLSQTRDENGIVVMETLYLPNETIGFQRVNGEMVVVHRDPHNLGRVPITRLLNRERASDVFGRSEITRPVRYLTEAAVRTLTGMEVNREFYTTPKWTALNIEPEVFGMSEENSDEQNARAGWSATAGRLNVIPPQEDVEGNPIEPKLHEFRPNSPAPFIEQIKAYSQLLSAECGIPAPYLGFVTDNPSSADAIRQQEYRLVKRAERRQTSFGPAWLEVARLALLIRGEYDREKFRQVSVSWRDAATPTRAAAADEAAKLIGANVLPPNSAVTYDRIGLTPQEQMQLAAEARKAAGGGALQSILANAQAQQPTAVDQAQELKTKADALGSLIRAGVDPDVAARKVGLDGLSFLPGRPITLNYDNVPA